MFMCAARASSISARRPAAVTLVRSTLAGMKLAPWGRAGGWGRRAGLEKLRASAQRWGWLQRQRKPRSPLAAVP
jgi:hypothetical protein